MDVGPALFLCYSQEYHGQRASHNWIQTLAIHPWLISNPGKNNIQYMADDQGITGHIVAIVQIPRKDTSEKGRLQGSMAVIFQDHEMISDEILKMVVDTYSQSVSGIIAIH